uniref:Rab-GAP TBC domain-containing protein n=1 Tax=Macaca fascicularis TaxID=9541 RepID=A0A7N9CKA7_MACFA
MWHLDKEGLCAQCSSFSWLLWMLNIGIFLGLILRLWDIYLLEGEQMLMPITSTAFKVQRSKSTCAQWDLGSTGVKLQLAQGQLPHTVLMILCSGPEGGLARWAGRGTVTPSPSLTRPR